MSEATEVSILSTTMMKPTKKSDDDSLLQYPNKIMKTPALKKRKYYINPGSVRHHSNCGSPHPSMAASKENKLPPSFSGFKSQKFLTESCYESSSYDGVSGTDTDEQSYGLVHFRWSLKICSCLFIPNCTKKIMCLPILIYKSHVTSISF